MFKHSRRTLTIVLTTVAVVLLSAALTLNAKPPPGKGNQEPPTDPALAFKTMGEIWVMNEDGSNLNPVVVDADAQEPSWSPDGNWLAFNNFGFFPPYTLEGAGLYKVSVDGGDLTLLVPAFSGAELQGVRDLAWSPAGDQIAYIWDDSTHASGQIRSVSPEGDNLQILFPFTPPRFPWGGLSWSPDATALTVVVMDYDVGHTFLGILDLETLTLEDVTGAEFEEVSPDSANWARNSHCIAFVGRRAGANEPGLWLLDLTVDSPQDPFRELVPGDGLSLGSPSWSPDDTRVLFTKHGGRPKDDGLWLVDVTTGGQTLLLGHARNTYDPDWRRF